MADATDVITERMHRGNSVNVLEMLKLPVGLKLQVCVMRLFSCDIDDVFSNVHVNMECTLMALCRSVGVHIKARGAVKKNVGLHQNQQSTREDQKDD